MKYKKYLGKYYTTSTRLKAWDYSQPGYYFITICTKNRIANLSYISDHKIKLSPLGHIAKKYWLNLANCYPDCRLDAFIIMPNHLHGIIVIKHPRGIKILKTPVEAIHELPPPDYQLKFRLCKRKMLLSKIIGRFKMQSTKHINLYNKTAGQQFWQSRFCDHIIRNEQSLSNIRLYIKNNAINWQRDKNNPAKF